MLFDSMKNSLFYTRTEMYYVTHLYVYITNPKNR